MVPRRLQPLGYVRADEGGSWSVSRLARQPDFAALLALESYRTSPTVDALGALLNVVDTSTTFVQRVDAHEDPIDAVARSADGRLAASGDRSGGVVIWEVADDGVVERRSDLAVDSACLRLVVARRLVS